MQPWQRVFPSKDARPMLRITEHISTIRRRTPKEADKTRVPSTEIESARPRDEHEIHGNNNFYYQIISVIVGSHLANGSFGNVQHDTFGI
jgi:hypothetical protein